MEPQVRVSPWSQSAHDPWSSSKTDPEKTMSCASPKARTPSRNQQSLLDLSSLYRKWPTNLNFIRDWTSLWVRYTYRGVTKVFTCFNDCLVIEPNSLCMNKTRLDQSLPHLCCTFELCLLLFLLATISIRRGWEWECNRSYQNPDLLTLPHNTPLSGLHPHEHIKFSL